MPTLTTISLFIVATIALVSIPGPNVIYIVMRSVDQGRWAGVISVLGVGTATIVHILAASLGISALLLSSSLLFSIVKYAGAVYLIVIGLSRLFSPSAEHQKMEIEEKRDLQRIYWNGFVVNLLNPKTALFFFAFLPQFVDPARGSVLSQTLLLGGLLLIVAISNDLTYAFLAGMISGWLRRSRVYPIAVRYITAAVYIALGVIVALTGKE
ncbi:LysE family translocator [Ktedonosporobacter rubrisoli]|uniref:LysE family translocator n=1 Tax=Ktedonosporobacter rubrisoli TaxID=2509675 RepID=A0A4P6K4C5_KTERU|nr:LysE family translocator [Ktedonosporobacter rubrisoli]QBD82905.1 LysE family translocator [Ktedonosporobacter rubrisoli]